MPQREGEPAYRSQLVTTDGNLWTSDLEADEIRLAIRSLLLDESDIDQRTDVRVRGPLYAEGWRDRVWYVPLTAIVAVSERR